MGIEVAPQFRAVLCYWHPSSRELDVVVIAQAWSNPIETVAIEVSGRLTALGLSRLGPVDVESPLRWDAPVLESSPNRRLSSLRTHMMNRT